MNKDKLLHIKEKSLEELKNRLDYEKVYEDKDGNFKLKGKFYENQTRLVLKNCGIIDPNNIDEYISQDGYFALNKAIFDLDRKEIIDIIKDSGLRGRGGAGFPTGRKWEAAFKQNTDVKYIICNADEGDPGAFMDRSILEFDPHSVLEAMTICARAIGSKQGYIYVRAEYPKAVKSLQNAIKQAREYKFMDFTISGSLETLLKKKKILGKILLGFTISIVLFGVASYTTKGYLYRSMNNLVEADKSVNIAGQINKITLNESEVFLKISSSDEIIQVKLNYGFEFDNKLNYEVIDGNLIIDSITTNRYDIFGLLDEPLPVIEIIIPTSMAVSNFDFTFNNVF